MTVPERNTNGTRVVDGNGGGKDSGVDGGGDGNDGGSDGGLRDLYGGVEMTGRVLMGTLKRFGVEVVNPGGEGNGTKGERFDPRIHEALFSARVEGREDGEVFRTEVKGYLLNGRVIRVSFSFSFSSLVLTGFTRFLKSWGIGFGSLGVWELSFWLMRFRWDC